MATGFPTKANWVSGDILTAAAQDDLAGTVNLLSNASAASGTVLVSNVAGTSFAYQPLQAAGKNAVINGGMDIWQRGTSISVAASASSTYTADRWNLITGANQAMTVSRQVTGDTTNLPNIQYCLRYQRNSGQTGTSSIPLSQSLETTNSIPYVGKTVTVSFYARAGANYSPTSSALSFYVQTGTGTDQNQASGYTGAANAVTGTATLTTTWQRFTATGTIGTTANELAVAFYYTPTGTAGANDYYEVTGVQVELGSVATTFSRAGGTLQGELAACQRYYWRQSVANALNYIGGIGMAISTTQARIFFFPPVAMRNQPTTLDVGALAISDGVTSTAVTGAGISTDANANSFYALMNVAAGLIQFRPYSILSYSSGAAYVGFSAEL